MNKTGFIKSGVLLCLALCMVVLLAACSNVGQKDAQYLKLESVERLGLDAGSLNAQLSDYLNEGISSSQSQEGEVWAIIQTEAATLADSYISNASGSFKSFISSSEGRQVESEIVSFNDGIRQELLRLGMAQEFKYDYTVLNAGFAVRTDRKYLSEIEKIEGVKSVSVSAEFTLSSAAFDIEALITETGILANDSEYKGDGLLVAVLDTGLDYNHSAFAIQPEYAPFTREDTQRFIDSTGRGRYISAKVPFSYDYAGNDNDVYPTIDHGTHVAGIIAGNDDTIQGVAINAQLAIMKTFPDNSTGGSQLDIIAALNDAVALGADIVNLSLGAANGFSVETLEALQFVSECYEQAEKLGVIIAAAAGNEYSTVLNNAYGGQSPYSPDIGVQGNPSSYESTLTIASINSFTTPCIIDELGNRFDFVNSVDIATMQYNDFLALFLGEEKTRVCEYVFIDGYGELSDYDGLDAEGKIAVVKRGGPVNFEQKQKIASEQGAIACLVYNNDHGFINMGVNQLNIPLAMITAQAGEILKNNPSNKLTISTENEGFGYLMSDFSSWGITGDLALSIDITAPGGEILSAGIGEYVTYSGTSMATPNAVGAIAVLSQYLRETMPSLTDAEIRATVFRMLMSTADIVKSKNGNPASVRKQGAGEINLSEAMSAQAYLSVDGAAKAKLSLGDDPDKTGDYSFAFNIVNITGEQLVYTPDIIVMSNEIDLLFPAYTTTEMRLHEAQFSFIAPGAEDGRIIVPAYSTVTVYANMLLSSESKSYLNEYFPNGDYIEGWITLEGEGLVSLSLPYLAYYGDYAALDVFDATIYDNTTATVFSGALYASYQSNYVVPLGAFLFNTPEGTELPDASLDNIAISRFGGSSNGIAEIRLGLLRNCSSITYTLTDKYTGELVYQSSSERASKSFYYVSAGAVSYNLLLADIYVETYNLANNQELVLTIQAESEFSSVHGKEVYDTLEFPVYVDFEAPEVLNSKSYTSEGRDYLEIEVYDNFALQGFMFSAYNPIDGSFRSFFDGAIPADSTVKGGIQSYTFDVTDYVADMGENEIFYINFADYGLNTSGYLFFTVRTDSPIANSIAGYKGESSVASTESDFTIVDGELRAYSGTDEVVEIPQGVTSVGNNVFNGNKTIQKVIIPEGVVRIKNHAFRDASNLTEIVIPSTLQELWTYSLSGTSITSLDLTSTQVRELRDYALFSCQQLKEVKLPQTVTSIGRFLFRNCSELEYVNFEDTSVRSLMTSLFENCVKLKGFVAPATVTEMYPALFMNCISMEYLDLGATSVSYINVETCRYASSLTKVVLPSTVQVIDSVAFNGCKRLTEINLEDTSLSQIGYGTFADCYALKEVTLPATLTNLGNPGGFAACTSLEKVTMLGNVTVIGTRVFNQTYSLKTLSLPASVIRLDEFAFEYSAIENLILNSQTAPAVTVDTFFGAVNDYRVFVKENTLNSYLENTVWKTLESHLVDLADFTVREGVMTSYNGTKQGVVLPPEIIQAIGSNAFEGSTAVTIKVPEGVEQIQAEAFKSAQSLKEITLPSTIKAIGSNAFTDTALSIINISAQTPPEVYSDTFEGVSDCEIYIPLLAISAYESADIWKDMNLMFSEEFELEGSVLVLYKGQSENVVIPEGITEIGANAFEGLAFIKDVVFPDSVRIIGDYAFNKCTSLVTTNLAQSNVEIIGDYAFAGCSSIESVELPQALREIGTRAFGDMDSLRQVTFAEGLERMGAYAFAYNTRLERVELPQTLTSMGMYAFGNCTSLKEAVLPESLTNIPTYAFAYCNTLEKVNFCETLEIIGANAFNTTALKEIDIPASCTTLGIGAFFTNMYTTKVTIRGNISTLEAAFERFFALEELYIYGDIGSIQGFDFSYTLNLKKIVISGEIGQIINGAFCGLAAESIVFEEYVGYIGGTAFNLCSSLTEVRFEKGVGEIGESAFNCCYLLENWSVGQDSGLVIDQYGVMYNSEMTHIYKQPFAWDYDGVYVMPESVETMADYAFSHLPRSIFAIEFTNIMFYFYDEIYDMEKPLLQGVVLSSRLQSIPDYAFMSFTSLESVTAPGNTEQGFSVGSYAFYNCYALTELGLPESTVSIGESAFENARGIVALKLPEMLQTLGTRAFAGCTALESLFIPANMGYFSISLVFSGCEKLNNIVVAEQNETFVSENGVIFNKDKSVLIFYPSTLTNEYYTVPDGVVSIYLNAFRSNKHLKAVVFPESLKSIGDKAFFETNVTTYLFTSLTAPRLQGLYNEGSEYYYANFVAYLEDVISQGITLRMYCPINGNYNDLRYEQYFAEIYPLTAEILRMYTNA